MNNAKGLSVLTGNPEHGANTAINQIQQVLDRINVGVAQSDKRIAQFRQELIEYTKMFRDLQNPVKTAEVDKDAYMRKLTEMLHTLLSETIELLNAFSAAHKLILDIRIGAVSIFKAGSGITRLVPVPGYRFHIATTGKQMIEIINETNTRTHNLNELVECMDADSLGNTLMGFQTGNVVFIEHDTGTAHGLDMGSRIVAIKHIAQGGFMAHLGDGRVVTIKDLVAKDTENPLPVAPSTMQNGPTLCVQPDFMNRLYSVQTWQPMLLAKNSFYQYRIGVPIVGMHYAITFEGSTIMVCDRTSGALIGEKDMGSQVNCIAIDDKGTPYAGLEDGNLMLISIS